MLILSQTGSSRPQKGGPVMYLYSALHYLTSASFGRKVVFVYSRPSFKDLTDLSAPPLCDHVPAIARCSTAARPPQRATPSLWSSPTTPPGPRCSGTGEGFPRYDQPTRDQLRFYCLSVLIQDCRTLCQIAVSALRLTAASIPEDAARVTEHFSFPHH